MAKKEADSKESGNSVLIAGTSNRPFAEQVSKKVGLPLFPVDILHFPDGECRVHIKGNIAGKQAIVIQSMGKKPNEYLVETLLIADALRRARVREIILACPYLAYSRQNLPESDGASLAARLFAHFINEAGVTKLITMDLHAESITSFYDFPVVHLTARDCFAEKLKKELVKGKDWIVVGPDLGSAKLSGAYAETLGIPFALLQKRRLDARNTKILSMVGEVKGKKVLLADDMCSTAGTLMSAVKECQEKGAEKIYAVVTHGPLVEASVKLIEDSSIELLFVSDSCLQSKGVISCSKICVVSVASTFAAAISSEIENFCR